MSEFSLAKKIFPSRSPIHSIESSIRSAYCLCLLPIYPYMMQATIITYLSILPLIQCMINISIRGGNIHQQLPITLTSSWATWTLEYENNCINLFKVEDSISEGWIQPTTYSKLYLPSDLPPPLIRPALGVALSNGIPRYIMPSAILSLDTPERRWRNRGINTLPRAYAWIDLFGVFSPKIESLKVSAFGQSTANVRFLEDQDGNAAWENAFSENTKNTFTSLRPDPQSSYPITQCYNTIKQYLLENPQSELYNGYHFVDIPLPNAPILQLPAKKLRMFLTDFENPKRLLEFEESLESEPLGELGVELMAVGAGGVSKYLPQVYTELFEPGNILFDQQF